MELELLIEILGYAASGVVVLSMLMRSVLRLRILSLIGSLMFLVYSVVIEAYPIAIVNGLLMVINIYFLREMLTQKDYFNIIDMHPDSHFLDYFLTYHQEEIYKLVPEFDFQHHPDDLIIMVLRNTQPAGLFIATHISEDTVMILLDYVAPGYRDFKVGNYIYKENHELFKTHNIKELVYSVINDDQKNYLMKMGFTEVSQEERGVFHLMVA